MTESLAWNVGRSLNDVFFCFIELGVAERRPLYLIIFNMGKNKSFVKTTNVSYSSSSSKKSKKDTEPPVFDSTPQPICLPQRRRLNADTTNPSKDIEDIETPPPNSGSEHDKQASQPYVLTSLVIIEPTMKQRKLFEHFGKLQGFIVSGYNCSMSPKLIEACQRIVQDIRQLFARCSLIKITSIPNTSKLIVNENEKNPDHFTLTKLIEETQGTIGTNQKKQHYLFNPSFLQSSDVALERRLTTNVKRLLNHNDFGFLLQQILTHSSSELIDHIKTSIPTESKFKDLILSFFEHMIQEISLSTSTQKQELISKYTLQLFGLSDSPSKKLSFLEPKKKPEPEDGKKEEEQGFIKVEHTSDLKSFLYLLDFISLIFFNDKVKYNYECYKSLTNLIVKLEEFIIKFIMNDEKPFQLSFVGSVIKIDETTPKSFYQLFHDTLSCLYEHEKLFYSFVGTSSFPKPKTPHDIETFQKVLSFYNSSKNLHNLTELPSVKDTASGFWENHQKPLEFTIPKTLPTILVPDTPPVVPKVDQKKNEQNEDDNTVIKSSEDEQIQTETPVQEEPTVQKQESIIRKEESIVQKQEPIVQKEESTIRKEESTIDFTKMQEISVEKMIPFPKEIVQTEDFETVILNSPISTPMPALTQEEHLPLVQESPKVIKTTPSKGSLIQRKVTTNTVVKTPKLKTIVQSPILRTSIDSHVTLPKQLVRSPAITLKPNIGLKTLTTVPLLKTVQLPDIPTDEEKEDVLIQRKYTLSPTKPNSILIETTKQPKRKNQEENEVDDDLLLFDLNHAKKKQEIILADDLADDDILQLPVNLKRNRLVLSVISDGSYEHTSKKHQIELVLPQTKSGDIVFEQLSKQNTIKSLNFSFECPHDSKPKTIIPVHSCCNCGDEHLLNISINWDPLSRDSLSRDSLGREPLVQSNPSSLVKKKSIPSIIPTPLPILETLIQNEDEESEEGEEESEEDLDSYLYDLDEDLEIL